MSAYGGQKDILATLQPEPLVQSSPGLPQMIKSLVMYPTVYPIDRFLSDARGPSNSPKTSATPTEQTKDAMRKRAPEMTGIGYIGMVGSPCE